MNQLTIAGHLGADPEVRFTSSGQKVTTFRLATRARRDETIWWRVTIWGEQFDKMIPYLKKGSPLIVVGELSKPEIFTNRDGQPQVSMNVTAHNLLFSPFGKPDGQSGGSMPQQSYDQGEKQERQFGQGQQQEQQQQNQGQESEAQESLADEEIPF